MKIALINENSQAAKSQQIFAVLDKVATKYGHTTFNYGTKSAEDTPQITYVQAGLMTAIICFDLIPEALNIISIFICIIGIVLGIISMIFFDNFINKLYKKNLKYNSLQSP